MTKKQVVEKQLIFRVKTGLKAGEHCWGAWNGLNPRDDRSIERFVDCCQNDRNCLKGSSSQDSRWQGVPTKM